MYIHCTGGCKDEIKNNGNIIAKTRPSIHISYSAQKPYLIATNLWANSWHMNPRPTTIIVMGNKDKAILKL